MRNALDVSLAADDVAAMSSVAIGVIVLIPAPP
jgi:hypothetical protein